MKGCDGVFAIFLFAMVMTPGPAGAETLADADMLLTVQGVVDMPLVDARDLSERSLNPIPGSLDYSAELLVVGKVLLLAPDEAVAVDIAQAIESRLPNVHIFIIAGGLETLRMVRPDLLPKPGLYNMPKTFTIPSNTCESGPALHVFGDD